MARTMSVPAIVRAAHSYLFYRDEEAKAKKAKERAVEVLGDKKRNLLKEYVDEHGTPNGKDYDWYFPEPITIGDFTYQGLRNQASEKHLFDDDRAQTLLAAKGLTDRVRREVTTVEWDYDELYSLNQEGLLTDDELDSLLEIEVSYSLVVIK
jgi:hypothetical protein